MVWGSTPPDPSALMAGGADEDTTLDGDSMSPAEEENFDGGEREDPGGPARKEIAVVARSVRSVRRSRGARRSKGSDGVDTSTGDFDTRDARGRDEGDLDEGAGADTGSDADASTGEAEGDASEDGSEDFFLGGDPEGGAGPAPHDADAGIDRAWAAGDNEGEDSAMDVEQDDVQNGLGSGSGELDTSSGELDYIDGFD